MSNDSKSELPRIPFLFTPQANLLASGMPDEQGLKEAAEYGVKRVINLCPSAETPITEPGTIAALGMEYINIPIAGPADLSRANTEKLAAVLDADEELTLIHCASSNRVGALIALKTFWIDGKPLADAINLGRASGLTRLEEAVKHIIQNS